MAKLTLMDYVKKARSQGYKIKVYKRKDGGIQVRSINGVRYEQGAGNRALRQLTGAQLSKAQTEQLTRITRERVTRQKGQIKQVGKYTKLEKIDKEIKNKLATVQRAWKKHPPKGQSGTRVLTKNIRKMLESGLTKSEILEALDRAQRYTQNIVYIELVNGLISEMQEANKIYDMSPNVKKYVVLIDNCINELQIRKHKIYMDDFEAVREKWYVFTEYAHNYEQGTALLLNLLDYIQKLKIYPKK